MVFDLLYVSVLVIVLCFSFVLIFGPPYLPTMKRQVQAAIKLADLKAGQTLLELGSGDGRVLIAAARAGLNVVGYELNPLLYAFSWLMTRRYRKQIKIVLGNFWQHSWPQCDAIYVFLLPRLMTKLEHKIEVEQFKNVPVLSFAFKFNNLVPEKEAAGVYLYRFKH